MADKLVIYNPESNDASHTPSDTVKGDITVNGSINVHTLDVGTINLSSDYRFYWANNSGKVYLEPRDQVSGNHQRYIFGSEHGLFIERNATMNPNVIYCETKSFSSDKVSQMGVQVTGDVWGDRWKNNGNQENQYMLSEYIDTLTTGNLTSGWTRLQNGLLLQWGQVDANNLTAGIAVFPTSFTTHCYFLPTMVNVRLNGDFMPIVYADSDTDTDLTQRKFYCRSITSNEAVTPLNTWKVNWFAIGY
ncbi:MAG: hypothetical protein [Caudoviricetes sp.]|nr:MAG: hypothetical protein [Caudoviricetes sp.]